MNTQNYDVIVLGGGSAGYAAARTAATHGATCAVVDTGHPLGGLCILRGCMPSKTLIYGAEVKHLADNAHLWGIKISSTEVDMAAIQTRKRKLIDEFASFREGQLRSGKFDLYEEKGVFTPEKTLQLANGKILKAEQWIICTGSVVNTPAVPGLKETPHWTSDDVLELETLPKSIIVLGGGIVACELSQMLSRLGSKVIQIQRSEHILKEMPIEASEVIEEQFRAEGLQLYTGTKIDAITYDKTHGYQVEFTQAMVKHKVQADHLMNAMGRRPNTQHLGLEHLDIKLHPSGHIVTNEYLQSSNPNVYAAGDCVGPHEIVHVAIEQGICAAHHACNQTGTPVDYNLLTKIIFTDPQVAVVGPSKEALNAQGIETITASYPMAEHGKSMLMEAYRGFIEVTAEKETGIIRGATCVGKDASELIHAMVVAITLKGKVEDVMKGHWYHPTLSEIWLYPLGDIAEQRRKNPA